LALSNNLPEKPGAFVCEPLKAAFGGANATPTICYRLKAVNQRHRLIGDHWDKNEKPCTLAWFETLSICRAEL